MSLQLLHHPRPAATPPGRPSRRRRAGDRILSRPVARGPDHPRLRRRCPVDGQAGPGSPGHDRAHHAHSVARPSSLTLDNSDDVRQPVVKPISQDLVAALGDGGADPAAPAREGSRCASRALGDGAAGGRAPRRCDGRGHVRAAVGRANRASAGQRPAVGRRRQAAQDAVSEVRASDGGRRPRGPVPAVRARGLRRGSTSRWMGARARARWSEVAGRQQDSASARVDGCPQVGP